jgi:hypothetical protein
MNGRNTGTRFLSAIYNLHNACWPEFSYRIFDPSPTTVTFHLIRHDSYLPSSIGSPFVCTNTW